MSVLKKLSVGDSVATANGKCFKKLSTGEPAVMLAAGLYDANDNLVASWDTLVNTYGMDVEKDYTEITNTNNYTVDPACPYYVLTNYNELSAGTKIVIAENITKIGRYAFCDCRRIKSVAISDGVTEIRYCAFRGCRELTDVIIGKNVQTIGASVFLNCKSLTSIIIPDGVTLIDMQAFKYTGLTGHIDIPNSVTEIHSAAFAYCNISSISLPCGLTEIDATLFEGCGSLANITIPDGVNTIYLAAFRYCSSLRSIVIPNSVTKIVDTAFYGCENLLDVYYQGTAEEWEAIAIGEDNTDLTNATIHYNEEAREFTDVVIVENGVAESAQAMAASASFNTIPTKTTDSVLQSNLGNGVFHFYYIEDEADVFLYTIDWASFSLAVELPYKGTISDISEATEDGYYAVMSSV